MKFESFAVTGSGEANGENKGNYLLNGFCNEDLMAEEAFDSTLSFGKKDIYAVADSSQSDKGGEIAVLSAINLLREILGVDFGSVYKIFFDNANKEVCRTVFTNKGRKSFVDMAVLYINRRKATAYNIGKSSIFMFDGEKLIKMSGDVPETEKVKERKTDDNKKVVFETVEKETAKILGAEPEKYVVSPYVSKKMRITSKSMFLLCNSDITDNISEEKIISILKNKKTEIDEKIIEIRESVLAKGGGTGSTVVLVRAKRSLNFLWGKIKVLAILALAAALIAALITSCDTLYEKTRMLFKNYVTEEETTDNERPIPWIPAIQPEENNDAEMENETTTEDTPQADSNAENEGNQDVSQTTSSQQIIPTTGNKPTGVKPSTVPKPTTGGTTVPSVAPSNENATPPVVPQEPPTNVDDAELPIDFTS